MIEEEGEVQLITECWVEPQHGICVNCSQMNKSLEGLTYKEITHSVSKFIIIINNHKKSG